jgi:hypothetical protein
MPHRFHEWRKRVKDHWYHVRLFQGIWMEVMTGYEHALKTLSDSLGDDHNLVVFRQTLFDHPEEFGKGRDIQVILELSDRRRAELQIQAKSLGQGVYAESPSCLCARFRHYIRAWEAEGQRSKMLARKLRIYHIA